MTAAAPIRALRVIEAERRVDEITEQARAVPFGRTMLMWLAAVLYGLGYGIAAVFGAVWFALTWMAIAVRLGWLEARRESPVTDASG